MLHVFTSFLQHQLIFFCFGAQYLSADVEVVLLYGCIVAAARNLCKSSKEAACGMVLRPKEGSQRLHFFGVMTIKPLMYTVNDFGHSEQAFLTLSRVGIQILYQNKKAFKYRICRKKFESLLELPKNSLPFYAGCLKNYPQVFMIIKHN